MGGCETTNFVYGALHWATSKGLYILYIHDYPKDSNLIFDFERLVTCTCRLENGGAKGKETFKTVWASSVNKTLTSSILSAIMKSSGDRRLSLSLSSFWKRLIILAWLSLSHCNTL